MLCLSLYFRRLVVLTKGSTLRVQGTFQTYLKAAKAVYATGVTNTWTEADAQAKPNYFVALLLGIGGLILGMAVTAVLSSALAGFSHHGAESPGAAVWVDQRVAVELLK